jgi:lysophospholipase L1-like esterase
MMNMLGKAGLALSSTVIAMLALEAAVRILDIPPRPLPPLPISSYQLSENRVIGYEYRPGYSPSDTPYDWSHRGYAINSAGFRDDEFDEAKPEGTIRIIALGDSTTAGNGVLDVDRTFTQLLEKRLNESRGDEDPRYEVFNMGVGGYHTMQEAETLRTKGMKYDPDLVLLTFCMNDFHLHADGRVHDQLSKVNQASGSDGGVTVYNRFLRLSRLAFIVHHQLRDSVTEDDAWYKEKVLKGRSTVGAGLQLLSELHRHHGFGVLVVILPEFRAPFGEYQSRKTHERVFDEARGLPGIAVVDLLESFASTGIDASALSYDDRLHMNEAGHAAMAAILLPLIRRETSSR